MENWIDVSVPLRTGMVHWPDNPPVSIERVEDIERGDTANVSKLSMGAHTGTHMDAPLHFFQNGRGIDAMPLSAAIGLARVIEIHDPESIKLEELRPYGIQSGERVLFKTRNSAGCWRTDDFIEDFVYISQEAARYLAAQHVQTVGVDYLSVGGFYKDGVETHHALLGAGIWIIEGLNLSNVQADSSNSSVCLSRLKEATEHPPGQSCDQFRSRQHNFVSAWLYFVLDGEGIFSMERASN